MEKNLAFRTIGIVLFLGLCVVSQAMGLSAIVNGRMGSSDDLKQRILYWSIVCSVLYAVMVYLLSRWFTKDMYWKWRYGDMWGLSPTFKSMGVLKYVKGFSGVFLGLSLTGLFVISVGLSTWLSSLAKIAPTIIDGELGDYNVTIIGVSAINPKGYDLLTQDATQIAMGAVGIRELTKDGKGGYIWTPMLNNSEAMTLDVDGIEVYRLAPRCRRLGINEVGVLGIKNDLNSSIVGMWNITVGGNVLEVLSKNKGHNWKTWTIINSTRQGAKDYYQSSTLYSLHIKGDEGLGESVTVLDNGVSGPGYVYATECKLLVETGVASGYLNSHKPIRFEMRNFMARDAINSKEAFAWRGVANVILATLDTLDFNNGTPLYHPPLWRWMMGYTEEAPSVESWMDNKLASFLGYTLTERFSYSDTSNITARQMMDTSIILVNGRMLWIGTGFQALFVVIVVAIYCIHRRDGTEWRSDDLTHIVSDPGKKDEDEEDIALM